MKNTAAKHFWDWFLKCQESFLHLPLLPKARKLYLLDELQVHLAGCCCQYIYAEIFYDSDCTRATMIITANGDPKRFKRVERLVNKAPLLKGWQFQALLSTHAAGFPAQRALSRSGYSSRGYLFLPGRIAPGRG
jgi:hypothetical protein